MNGGGGDLRRVWLIRIAVVVGVGLLLGRLGPFGTFADLNPVARYGYWVGLTLLMWLQGLAALAVIDAAKPALGRPITAVLAALLGAIPTAFEVAWAEMWLRVERDLSFIDILQILGDVCLLSVPLLAVTHLVIRSRASTHQIRVDTPDDTDWLISRLPPQRRGRLLALESEDHYVRVRTSRGDELLHMRFGDAVSRLPPDIGSRVHRSWWVARDAVRSERREGDRIVIELLDGTQVPVSRSYIVSARAAGLITAN